MRTTISVSRLSNKGVHHRTLLDSRGQSTSFVLRLDEKRYHSNLKSRTPTYKTVSVIDEDICVETRWTYHWGELGDSCKQKPHDALSDGYHISGRREPRHAQGRPPLYLFPKQEPQATFTCAVTAQPKQANEHYDQQHEVGDKHGDECW